MTDRVAVLGIDVLPERIRSKIRIVESGCWRWTAATNPKGYGIVLYRGQGALAHRVVKELLVGPIAPGKMICHHCDNPICVNPAHTFEGTHADNMADRNRKGRQARGPDHVARMKRVAARGLANGAHTKPWRVRRGEGNHAKLTTQQVTEMRRRHAAGEANCAQLGSAYGVHATTVRDIVKRRKWRHVA